MKTFWSLCKVNDTWRLACRPGRAATSATGALPPYRSEREGQQRVGYDPFAKPSGKDRFLREPAVHSG